MNRIITIAVVIASAACTTVDYTSQDFSAKTVEHQLIAILPFEMVLTGRTPKEITPQQVTVIEEAESLAFQTALYHSMLNRASADRKRPILVEIQPVETTNLILERHGIPLREAWSMPAQGLANILGVDAVVRTTVQKTRYLSDLESFGIDLGTAALWEATDGRLAWIAPLIPGVTTVDIWADSTRVDGRDGEVLWKVALQRSTDWTRPADDVVVGITRKLARKFPYRT